MLPVPAPFYIVNNNWNAVSKNLRSLRPNCQDQATWLLSILKSKPWYCGNLINIVATPQSLMLHSLVQWNLTNKTTCGTVKMWFWFYSSLISGLLFHVKLIRDLCWYFSGWFWFWVGRKAMFHCMSIFLWCRRIYPRTLFLWCEWRMLRILHCWQKQPSGKVTQSG